MRWLLPLLLAGCAAHPPVNAEYYGHTCAGQEITIRFKQYESWAPAVECARRVSECGASDADVALMLAALPIACAYRGPRCNVVVLPVGAPEWVRWHEYAHLEGRDHSFLLPTEPGCP